MAYFIYQPHPTDPPLNHHLLKKTKTKWDLIPRGPILSLLYFFYIIKFFNLFLDIIKLSPPLITPSPGQAHGRPAMTIEHVI
jgi:hypothetical protein